LVHPAGILASGELSSAGRDGTDGRASSAIESAIPVAIVATSRIRVSGPGWRSLAFVAIAP
jgi:hypothetical protein